MAQISNEEKARRDINNDLTVREIRRALDKGAVRHGDVKGYKKSGLDKRAIEEALGGWFPNVSATKNEDGTITLSVGAPKVKKVRKAKAAS